MKNIFKKKTKNFKLNLLTGIYFTDSSFKDENENVFELSNYSTDLTELAQEGKFEGCFGREKELLEMMEILIRRHKNNPVLVGDAGVGKTAILELFAKRIVDNLVPFVLQGSQLLSIDMSRIISGARFRGEFEERIELIINTVLSRPNTIIFIDEIHMIVGAGASGGENSMDAGNILKPALSRSGFQCIGATTPKEYQIIENDPALNRRFQPIEVKEPTIDQAVDIMYRLRANFEAFHNVEIMPSALRLAVELTAKYIPDRFLPDKAIDLIDRVAARQVIRLTTVKEGSIIGSLINSSLKNIGKLKLEAFRRGDIAVEFVFQEIENAYRNFLLRWVENPVEIPQNPEVNLSPISHELFTKMQLAVLTRIDDLLFSSTKLRQITKIKKRKHNLSESKNNQILEEFQNSLNKTNLLDISSYRISLFLFDFWIKNQEKISSNFEMIYIGQFRNIFKYLCQFNQKKEIYGTIKTDFLNEDIENFEEQFEYISKLEETRIDVVNDFLTNFKPILKKGIIQSLSSSSEIVFTDDELSAVYSLLGYYSTETGKNLLSISNDIDLIKRARALGDFSGLKKIIQPQDVQNLLSEITGIPIKSMSIDETEKLLNLELTLHKRVIGQEEAISAIANSVRRSRLGLQNPNRPLASFLFCGPTGVGKTEVTKALAVAMFGSEEEMIRLDMSEYMEKIALSRLIGSPPGYVGYEDGGELSDAVRKKPYSVVLFDEVEKAHSDILNILLQILEDGRLTDSKKRLIPFNNTVIILTSNAAAGEIQELVKEMRERPVNPTKELKESKVENVTNDNYAGVIKFLESPVKDNYFADIQEQLRIEFEKSFRTSSESENLKKHFSSEGAEKVDRLNKEKEDLAHLKETVIQHLGSVFLPEFLNRLDDIIVFQPLKPEELRKICDIMINSIIQRAEEKNILLDVHENVKIKLSKDGYNPAFGARPLRRLITKHIENLLSDFILKNSLINQQKSIRIVINSLGDIVAEKF